MMPTDQALHDALRQSLSEIEMQIKHIQNDIAKDYKPEERDKINVWYWTYDVSGKPVLHDLLVAKAQLISAMANLKASSPTRSR